MRLTLDAEQRQLVATARQFVERTFDPAEQAVVRNGESAARTTLQRLAPLGWPGLAMPEDVGGAGGSLIDLGLVQEELGRRGVTTPIVGSLVATTLIHGSGDAGSHKALLDGLAEGEVIATLASLSPGADEWSVQPATGRAAGDGWMLDGAFTLVAYGEEADVVLVPADLEGRGLSIVVVPTATVAVSRQQVLGGEPRAAIVLDGVPVGSDAVLSVAGEATTAALARARDLATVLHAAHAVGAAEGALILSVTWAKEREQFGRPIGSFQTVSNRCADMRLGIDAARLLTWEAAWALDGARADAPERVATAKAYLNAVADTVVFNSHQVHGAIGYSTEYPLHVLTRTLMAFRASWGTSRVQLDRVAAELGL